MGNPADSIRQTIAELEAQREQIDATLAQLRGMLDSWTNGTSPSASGARRPAGGKAPTRKPAFERKYDAPAKELIGKVLRESRKQLNAGQVTSQLEERGYHFKKQTIALYISKLEKEGKVKQHKAPAGSGHTYAYSWVATELPFGSGGANA